MRRILSVLSVTVLPLLLAGCPKGNSAFKQAQKAELSGDLDSALVYYDRALKTDPGDADYKLHAIRARFNAGQFHVDEGEKALNKGQLELALAEFQKAEAIDPSSVIAEQDAKKTLELIGKTKAEEQPKPTGVAPPEYSDLMAAPPELKPLSREPIALSMGPKDPRNVFDAVAKMAGISVIYDPDFLATAPHQISVQLSNVTVEQALDVVALESKAFWKPVTSNIILVAPDNRQKRLDLDDEEVQTFYIHNDVTQQDLTETANLLRQVLDIQRIQQVNSQNAIVVRSTPDKLMLAKKIIDSIDKAKPEVVIQVDVLQASVDKLHDLGLLPGQSAVLQFTPGTALQPSNSSSSSGSSSSTPSTGNQVTLGNIRNLSANDWSATLPGAALTALMTDTTTKVIQNPTVRITDGGTAKLHIGDKVPFATGSFQAGLGVSGTTGISPLVNTQFQFQEVGVKLEVTPRVHPDGEVSIKETVDISSVVRTESIGGVDEPVIGENSIENDVRLKNGESNILGGLIDKETTKILNGWPGVAHIPFLKYFFSDNKTESTDTEVLIALTPHVVRMPDITPEDARTIAAGTDTNIRVYPKEEQTPPPAPPQAQAQPGANDGGGNTSAAPDNTAATGASLQFQPDTISLKPGDTTTVGLMVSNAKDLFSIPLLLQYNPAVIEVEDIRNGGFLSGGTQDIAVVQQVNQQQGQAVVSATRQPNTPGINGSGTLLGIVIKALAPGTSQLQILQVSPRDSQQKPIPVTSGSATVRVQ